MSTPLSKDNKKTGSNVVPTSARRKEVSAFQFYLGMSVASIFSLVYIFSPIYILTSVAALLMQYPSRKISMIYGAPLIISLFTPAMGMPSLGEPLKAVLNYFDYEEIHEVSNDDLRKDLKEKKKFIMACQPHGVISFVGICSWASAPQEFRSLKTAVASVLLSIPILKNVMGIFSLTDASGKNVRRILQKGQGLDGCIILYIGGIAELFKSSRKEERLYLKKRKGFIKVALREGVDIIPVYLFGNTSVLTVMKTGPLAQLSRKFQVSLTYFWGQYNLPIPRPDKLLYVRGKPLGLPHIPEPTDEDINKWHAKYCDEVSRLFNENKDKLPAYKNKTLHID
eukprot:CAMPEP_0197840574 /NCGR_PEP_ID=MMETSP1437-20131217/45681_1 /TAXON_ID=49252 ORGANISM="Eucampia antarctica, Strain CCMP1452" /NCGR_SAMPLE_ID=MMETSP1437 /ASSEMBLY_ACC=CAM_ASM_001096 /LENGTH=338 /DNA_ID=CAMNT_0043450205 /DNA_START=103 /DNA_END=1119 /DNA_ORIENTATION=+